MSVTSSVHLTTIVGFVRSFGPTCSGRACAERGRCSVDEKVLDFVIEHWRNSARKITRVKAFLHAIGSGCAHAAINRCMIGRPPCAEASLHYDLVNTDVCERPPGPLA